MLNILPTIGPATEKSKDLKYILKVSDLVRLNASHGDYNWHYKISRRIKSLKKDVKILLDIPGIKPRSNNNNIIKIKKNEKVYFSYDKNIFTGENKKILITNPLPRINKSLKFLSISDGKFKFKIIKLGKNYIKCSSLENIQLHPKRGLNFPNAIYNENLQNKNYVSFLKKFRNINFDAIGLSYVQSDKIIKKIKKLFPDKIILSKIENSEGLRNLENITKCSDVIMVDRGDLGAEIGDEKLFDSLIQISEILKSYGKPLIMGTENLDSMLSRSIPTKSEIVSLGFSEYLEVDKIMLSDETATSKNWKKIIQWINHFNKNKKNRYSKKKINTDGKDIFWNSIGKIKNIPFVIFTRKGNAIEKINQLHKNTNLVVFTDNKKTYTYCKFRLNTSAILVKKFGQSKSTQYIYESIKKNINLIFKDHKEVFLIYVSFPRAGSRANTLELITKKDFI